MTVGELIKELKKFNPDENVYIVDNYSCLEETYYLLDDIVTGDDGEIVLVRDESAKEED